MIRLLPALTLGLLVGCGASQHDGHAEPGKDSHTHGDPHKGHASGVAGNATLHVGTTPQSPTAGQPAALRLIIHDAKGEMQKEFAVVHDQKVHLIVVREGLDQFAHLHPEVDGAGNMKVSYTFPAGGKYHLFADHQPTGKTAQVARADLQVGGDAPTAQPLVANVPGTLSSGDEIAAEVTVEKGRDVTVTFRLREAGKPVTDVEPYMGARGHLVVLSADAKEYVHAHPEDGAKASGDQVSFGVHFPGPGLYKGWGQFKRGGKVHTIPFVTKVE
jgi:hypothetical protein